MALVDPWLFNYTQGNLIVRIDYDANSNAIYQGWAIPGTAEGGASLRNAGIGVFGQTDNSDIGAIQHSDVVGGSVSVGF